MLTVLDLVALNGAALLVLAMQKEPGPGYRLTLEHALGLVLQTGLWLPLAHAFDAYDLRKSSRLSLTLRAVLPAGILTTLAYGLIAQGSVAFVSSRFLSVICYIALAMVLTVAGRALYVLALFQPVFQRRALIVGAGWAGRTIAQAVREHSDGTYWLVGFVDDDPVKQGARVVTADGSITGNGGPTEQAAQAPDSVEILPVLGDRHALKGLIAQHRVTALILAITHEVPGELLQTLMDCLQFGVEIVAMPVLYEQLTGRVPIEHVGDNWYVAMPLHHPGTGTMWPLIKRLLDIILALVGLVLLALVTPFIAVAIYLDGRGPILYTQERVGKGGRRFRAYKFRSMVPDAEKDGAVWAGEGDHRITRVGRFLRKTHVDEFPQFLNILKGDMSAVGPRPERPEFVERLAREIPFFRVRNAIRPGMAGWALVKQGYGSSQDDALLKLQYDLYYIKHQSLWLDAVILVKTIVSCITFSGR